MKDKAMFALYLATKKCKVSNNRLSSSIDNDEYDSDDYDK